MKLCLIICLSWYGDGFRGLLGSVYRFLMWMKEISKGKCWRLLCNPCLKQLAVWKRKSQARHSFLQTNRNWVGRLVFSRTICLLLITMLDLERHFLFPLENVVVERDELHYAVTITCIRWFKLPSQYFKLMMYAVTLFLRYCYSWLWWLFKLVKASYIGLLTSEGLYINVIYWCSICVADSTSSGNGSWCCSIPLAPLMLWMSIHNVFGVGLGFVQSYTAKFCDISSFSSKGFFCFKSFLFMDTNLHIWCLCWDLWLCLFIFSLTN